MNEELMNKLLMITGMVVTILTGLATVGLLIACALDFGVGLLFCSILLGFVTVGLGMATAYFGRSLTGKTLVFTNEAEQEVLTARQRRELRRARGEVVMERALIEVQHERDNITHRQLEAADDPEKPPYQTRWTPEDWKSPKKVLGDR
jgi:hypothetical protein